MLHCWRKILLKSDIICPSYKKVHRGLLFFQTQCSSSASSAMVGSSWLYRTSFGSFKVDRVAEFTLATMVQHHHSGYNCRVRPEVIDGAVDRRAGLPTSTMLVVRRTRIGWRSDQNVCRSDVIGNVLAPELDLKHHRKYSNTFIRQKTDRKIKALQSIEIYFSRNEKQLQYNNFSVCMVARSISCFYYYYHYFYIFFKNFILFFTVLLVCILCVLAYGPLWSESNKKIKNNNNNKCYSTWKATREALRSLKLVAWTINNTNINTQEKEERNRSRN